MFTLLSTARKAAAKIIAVVSVIGLAACDPSMMPSGPTAGGPNIDTQKPVRVALLLPKSDQSAQSLPRDLENAARMAVADLQGVQIDLQVYDTGGTPTQAAAVATQAVTDGAKIIIGPLYQQNAVAASQAVAASGINVLSFSNNPEIGGGNLFVLGDLFDTRANRLVNFAARQGKRSGAIMYENSTGGQLGRDAIAAAAARNGVSIVGSAGYDLNAQSLSSAISQVRGMISQAGAQAVFLTDNWDQGLGVALQLMPEQGIDPASTQYVGLSRWDTRPDGFNIRGVEGGWFTVPDRNALANFQSRFQAQFGNTPHPLAGLAFDGVAAVGALIGQGRSDALTAAALTQTAGFQGTGGVFRLRPDGTNERALAIATVRNKQVVILDPSPTRFGGF
ncbi:penicillin-binding protein activator [Mesobacterium sp. TK19101]|uniref:Penicillin-binding protein activator n=1 Tax=Mesobacterium hydrothermale TaxID=3111907 RepID=A0ABU6HL86_9RHOB|nr:penicillin-binding protein activator [Mesobacterium sp. TK19101]MEC3862615.1 penicillin-binding protein activator [Mesobacterium sp. TK19101]